MVVSNFVFQNARPANIREVRIAGRALQANVASTPEARARGLSGRTGFPEGAAALFVFEEPGRHAFLMKDMLFPIDIIWVGEDFQVVDVKENARPETYPAIFVPASPALYVLEVSAGFAKENDVKIGDLVEF